MVLPGHLSGGFLAAKTLLDVVGTSSLSHTQIIALLIFGTIAGDFPDMDLFFFYWNQITKNNTPKKEGHRDYITHIPLFWLAVAACITLIGWLCGSLLVEMLGILVLTGTWSHFLFDSIEFGIRWLAPFSNRRFCLIQVTEPEIPGVKGSIPYYWTYIKQVAFTRITTYVEIVVTLVAIWVAFHN